jgi:UDP-glucose 4-epimerase
VAKVLVVGVSGGQGRLVARRLARKHEIVGVDRDQWTTRSPNIPFHQVDIRKRAFEDVFRKERPTAVVHLGFVRHFRTEPGERYDVNVRGTRRLLDHCQTYGVRRLVVVSSGYVYGALAENPHFMDEDYPLGASRNYPEIRDLVEVDTLTTSFMWRNPEVHTVVLRPVNTLGRYVHSAIGMYLRMRRVIVMTGFNPMLQFIHEEDLTEAIRLCVDEDLRGVFNVTGAGEVPVRVAIRETGGRPLSLPEPIARPVIGQLYAAGLFPLPAGAIDFIKYPCTVSGKRFAEASAFRPAFGLRETFQTLRD